MTCTSSFGAASAATQIEDQNPNSEWYLWTLPVEDGGLGKGEAFVGDASMGFTRALDDVGLIADLDLDSYRFSIEWARVEPERDVIDEAALQHYSDFIDALLSLPIGLKQLQYAEGGPEAQLYVKAGGVERELVGSFETGFFDDSNLEAWPVPNVIGVRARR